MKPWKQGIIVMSLLAVLPGIAAAYNPGPVIVVLFMFPIIGIISCFVGQLIGKNLNKSSDFLKNKFLWLIIPATFILAALNYSLYWTVCFSLGLFTADKKFDKYRIAIYVFAFIYPFINFQISMFVSYVILLPLFYTPIT